MKSSETCFDVQHTAQPISEGIVFGEDYSTAVWMEDLIVVATLANHTLVVSSIENGTVGPIVEAKFVRTNVLAVVCETVVVLLACPPGGTVVEVRRVPLGEVAERLELDGESWKIVTIDQRRYELEIN
jgi:hypothetical protein